MPTLSPLLHQMSCLTPAVIRRTEHCLNAPDEARDLAAAPLTQILAPALVAAALDGDASFDAAVGAIYDVAVSRVPAPRRRGALEMAAEMFFASHAEPAGLLVVVDRDPTVTIAARAARHFALARGIVGPDILDGVDVLLDRIEADVTGETPRLAMLLGALEFGAIDTTPALRGRWRQVPPARRPELCLLTFPMLTVVHLEFLLDWLNTTDRHRDLEIVADHLEALPGTNVEGVARITHERFAPDCDHNPLREMLKQSMPPGVAAMGTLPPPEHADSVSAIEPMSFADVVTDLEPAIEPLRALPDGPQRIVRILDTWRRAITRPRPLLDVHMNTGPPGAAAKTPTPA